MNIHEYQAKALLHEFGVPISKGVPVLRPQDSDAAAKTLPGPIWVVKSQIHAGGRGKGKFKEKSAGDKGGVRIAKSIAEVNEFANRWALLYGIIAVIGAAGAGWLASLPFRNA
jgi:succinyl-CoA synthetase beta subunit